MPYRYKKISVHGRKVDEHRYVMEQHVGRYLQTDEIVRHKNDDPKDNRLTNLYITSRQGQVAEQIKAGQLPGLSEEGKNKGRAICRKRLGKKVMISFEKKDLIIVESIKVAAKITGTKKGNVSKVLKGERNHSKGFHFRLAASIVAGV